MSIKILIRKILIFSIPFLGLIILYLYLDPFKTVRHYQTYYTSGKNYILLNQDVVSTETWLNNYPSYKFNSYIFGSSRSMFYEVNTWEQYIHQNTDSCYHYDAYGESLYGIEKKINFLSGHNASIKNALLIFDEEVLSKVNNADRYALIKDPKISGESRVIFHLKSMQGFFNYKFLTAYLDLKINHQLKPYMENEKLMDNNTYDYNKISNEKKLVGIEKLITENANQYYTAKKNVFYQRASREQTGKQCIGKSQLNLLLSIKTYFDKCNTNYRIVISPLYDQIKLNPADLKILKSIFGNENVYDFSGINSITSNITSYYEASHYRPFVSAAILKTIYSNNK